MSPHPSFAVVDLETTGLSHTDRIIEIGVVLLRADGTVEKSWETLVQPDRDIANSFVHKLTATDLVGAPRFAGIAQELAGLLHGRTLVAHNANFEVRFLQREFERLGVTLPRYGAWVQDTMHMSRSVLQLPSPSLASALQAANLTNARPHSALADAMATAELFNHLRGSDVQVSVNTSPLLFPAAVFPAPQPVLPRHTPSSKPEGEGTWLNRLMDKLPATSSPERGGEASNTQTYRTVLRAALADKVLVASELQQLEIRAQSDGLAHSDILLIHEEFVKQLAIEAWLDGVVTDEERRVLHTLASQLGIESAHVESLLEEPQLDTPLDLFRLQPGHRVALTGQMDLPRDVWVKRIESVGLEVGGISRQTAVVVAANPDTCSGKAKQARQWGIPIVNEKAFAQMIRALVESDAADTTPEPDAAESLSAGSAVQEWIELFPWLATSNSVPDTAMNSLTVAQLWIDEHPGKPLESMSPVLGSKPRELVAEELTSNTVLDRRWLANHPHLLSATVVDLRDIPGVGKYRLLNWVERVVLFAADNDGTRGVDGDALAAHSEFGHSGVGWLDGFYADDAGSGSDQIFQPDVPPGTDSGTKPGKDPSTNPDVRPIPATEAAVLAGWLHLQSRVHGAPAFPDALLDATPRWAQLTAAISPVEHLFQAAVVRVASITGGDERKAMILADRWMGNSTLDDIGQQYGVSRERIRQLERQMKEALDARRGLFDAVVETLAEHIGPLQRVEAIRRDFPELMASPVGWDRTFSDIFVALGQRWIVENGWAMHPEFETQLREALTSHADSHGVAELADVADALDIAPDLLEEYLAREASATTLLVGDKVVVSARNHQDRAVAMLALNGEPMTLEDIVTALGGGNPRSMANQLYNDPRLTKVSNYKWALAEWGMEEFRSIVEWISARIDASPTTVVLPAGHGQDARDEQAGQGEREPHGRQEVAGVPLAALLADAAEKEVSQSSVKAYAHSADFQVVDGIMIRATGGTGASEPVRSRSIDETRDMVWRDGHWHMLVTVTYDHLRGSGFAAGSGLATHFGISPNESKTFQSRLGEQHLRVNRLGQLQVSTMRRFLDELGASEGDRVFLRFGDDDVFDVVPAPAPCDPDATGITAVYSALGLELPAGQAAESASASVASEGGAERLGASAQFDAEQVAALLVPINRALGLSDHAARRRTVGLLRHRRQDDLADILQEM